MKTQTKLFGDISIAPEKIIEFKSGIIGFPEMKHFSIIVDEEKESSKIVWLQSMEEGAFSLPVIEPFCVMTDYNPVIEDEYLSELGEFVEEDLIVFVTLNVPADVTKMCVNLKAPLVINTKTKQACQVITDDERYPVRFPVYDILKKKKEEAGE